MLKQLLQVLLHAEVWLLFSFSMLKTLNPHSNLNSSGYLTFFLTPTYIVVNLTAKHEPSIISNASWLLAMYTYVTEQLTSLQNTTHNVFNGKL